MNRLLGNATGIIAIVVVPGVHWVLKFIGLASLPQDMDTWIIVVTTMFDDPWLSISPIIGIAIITFTNIPVLRFWEHRHVIALKPQQFDSLVRFPSSSLLPDMSKNNPFSLLIINLAEYDIVGVVIKFDIIGMDLRDVIINSQAFPIVKDNEKDKVLITTKSNGEFLSQEIDLKTNGERKIDIIKARDQSSLDMPMHVKTALSIHMISESYRDQQEAPDMKVFDALSNGDFEEVHKLMSAERHGRIIKMPDIKVTISYLKQPRSKMTQRFVLKSVYQPTGGSFWVTDNRADKPLNYLEGGFGVLSFNNANEPECGFYNQWAQGN